MPTEDKKNGSPPEEYDLDQAKLNLEKWRAEEDITLRRLQINEDVKLRQCELELRRRESSKRLWSSPLLIAIIGLFTTILVSIVQNSCQGAANQNLERQRFESNRDLERQKFESTLIQKALESSSRNDARERFQSYLALGLIRDEATKVQMEKYIKEPDTIPLQPLSNTPTDDDFGSTARAGDNFIGVSRRDAKLSIGNGNIETFNDLQDLIASLPADNSMINHTPRITTVATSGRADEEQRNVKVRCYVYAASREDSNDFLLIVGRAPDAKPERYMVVTISGLPAPDSPAFQQLNDARTSFKNFFVNNFDSSFPGFTYDFYDPPFQVEIVGSLFFNISHATGVKPGPKAYKPNMPTLWEIRPITKITFPTN